MPSRVLHISSLVPCIIACILFGVLAQIPCDDSYANFCPEESGWDVGECLKKLAPEQLSDGCTSFIKLHDSCISDINEHCAGYAYTNDVLACLTEWTRGSDLEDDCKDSLPKKNKEPEKKELSAEDKKRAADRRR